MNEPGLAKVVMNVIKDGMKAGSLKVLTIVMTLTLPLAFAAAAPETLQEQQISQQRPVRAVVELFTSQGCSSCPPADRLLQDYVASKDVMALSLPVDYWDYIGWKDTLASPKNAQRQRSYVTNFRDGPMYTPQVVVNGRAEALGSSRRQIENAIMDTTEPFAKQRIPVHSWYNNNTIIIRIGSAPLDQPVKEATIWLTQIQKSASVDIKAGENRGRSLTYKNVVREMTPVGTWNGKAMTIRLSRRAVLFPETDEGAILVQEATHGPIIGAAWLGR